MIERVVILMMFVVLCASIARGGINPTGEVDPADPATWTTSTTAIIGDTGAGSVTVDADSDLLSKYIYLGDQFGSTGTVNLSGIGSTWTNSRRFYIGHYGRGAVQIDSGAVMDARENYIGYYPGSIGELTILGDGSLLTGSSVIYVGDAGAGELDIRNGADVSIAWSIIGRQSGSTGSATIDGPGSTWTSSSNFHVGEAGDGSLDITSGAVVSNNRDARIGDLAGSTGVVTVSGAGSVWTSSGLLSIGEEGSGVLNIDNGGLVEVGGTTSVAMYAGSVGSINFGLGGGTLTTGGFIGAADNLSGDGVINTNALVGDVDMIFDAANGLAQTLAITGPGRNITVNLDVDGSGAMGVGHGGEGSMRISDGLVVESTLGFAGYGPGSNGEVTVGGAGSSWVNSSGIGIGYYGVGSLEITSGATVSSTGSSIGTYAGSSGSVTVSGDGSSWTNSGNLNIGYSGAGSLEITSGAAVSNASATIGYRTGSSGSVIVSGNGTTWTNSGNLSVGGYTDATLDISGGAVVSNSYGSIAGDSESQSQVTVSGVGSIWRNSMDLTVGGEGDAVLNIADGALVEVLGTTKVGFDAESTGEINFDNGVLTTMGFIGAAGDLHGTGTINTNGIVTDVDLVFDASHGPVQTHILTGPGRSITVNLDLDGSGPLGVGHGDRGSMHISDGLVVRSTDGYIGFKSGSSGEVTVSGPGTTWDNFYRLYVGYYGAGALDISNGALVAVGDAFIGRYGGAVTVSGEGSALTIRSGLHANGALTVSNGADIYNGSTAYVSDYSDHGDGAVTIDGAGSTWTNNLSITVGHFGHGVMNITNGASVSSQFGRIGMNVGDSGEVNISGDGSTWTTSRSFSMSAFGAESLGSILNITNGGALIVDDASLNSQDSACVVTVSGNGSSFTSHEGLSLGSYGTTTLNISDGGVVNVANSTSVLPGPGAADGINFDNGTLNTGTFWGVARGVGTINTNGLVTDADMVFNASRGMKQTLKLAGPGQDVTVNLDTNASFVLGVGSEYTGSIHISDGAVVESHTGYLGRNFGASGSATVSGDGSEWSLVDRMQVGYSGDGVLDIVNGGIVRDKYCQVGRNAGSTGLVTVSGIGSAWIHSGSVGVGFRGAGTLIIIDGGLVSGPRAYLGSDYSATADMTVTGLGSRWVTTGDFTLGRDGDATLNIYDEGLVSVGDDLTIDDGSGDSFITMATGGKLALFGDADDSMVLFLGLIDGTDDIRYWEDSISDWANISGATPGEDYTLEYVTTGDLNGYTVLTVTTVPEPATMIVLALGGLAVLRRRGYRLDSHL